MIRSVRLWDFRCHASASINLAHQTALIGSNGRGKTSFLEALYLSAMGRSWRTGTTADIVRQEAESAKIEIELVSNDVLQLYIHARGKKLTRNGKAITWSRHFGSIPIVLFAPELSFLFHGTKEVRQRWLNQLCGQVSADYVSKVRNLAKYAQQKRSILQDEGSVPFDLIKTYNEQISKLSTEIWKIRQNVLKMLQPYLKKYMNQFCPSMRHVQIELINPEGILSQSELQAEMEKGLNRERAAKRVLFGAQRDDVAFEFGGKALKKTASRGEERSVLLCLLAAGRDVLEEQTQKTPLLLLDDVFSELDAERQMQLRRITDGYQSIITTTHKSHLEGFLDAQIIDLDAGLS